METHVSEDDQILQEGEHRVHCNEKGKSCNVHLLCSTENVFSPTKYYTKYLNTVPFAIVITVFAIK